MRIRSWLMTISLAVMLSAALCFASEPGQPLDCSDWVFLEPGLDCSVLVSDDCEGAPYCAFGDTIVRTNTDESLYVRALQLSNCTGESGSSRPRLELVSFDGQVERILAYVEGRCVPGNCGATVDRVDPVRFAQPCSGTACLATDAYILTFDEEAGDVLLPVKTRCVSLDPCGGCQYEGRTSLLRFRGFTTTFEIQHTYTPGTSELTFRVPFSPEGFPAADWIDTYYGDLATVGDWSQALPLQCGYPASAPDVGDYLTVADPLPDPAPGSGRYYVTAVTHQGQRRFGRQNIGGVLSGRDPATLPLCD